MSLPFMYYFFKSQFATLPAQTQRLDGQTFVVTGANTGLGYQAALSFVRQGAARVVLACRSQARGDAAVEAIAKATARRGVAETWPLDLADFDSIKAFAKRAEGLDRIDAVVENAGVSPTKPDVAAGGTEVTAQVNVYGTLLLLGLLLPKLRAVAKQHRTAPVVTIVSSEMHHVAPVAKIAELADQGALCAYIDDPKNFKLTATYATSKLLEVYAVRALAAHTGPVDPIRADGGVVVNLLNPGLVDTDLRRGVEGAAHLVAATVLTWLSRAADVGGRTLVFAATAGPASHGKYSLDCEINDRGVSRAVRSEKGKETQEKAWAQLKERLATVHAGLFEGY